MTVLPSIVIPAQAGTQSAANMRAAVRARFRVRLLKGWVPACAGMTMVVAGAAQAQRAPAPVPPPPPPPRTQPQQQQQSQQAAQPAAERPRGGHAPREEREARGSSRSPRIPAAYRGEWNRVAADCGTWRNDSRLIVEADAIALHEARGSVTRITADGADAVVVTLDMASERDRWSDTLRLARGADGTLVTAPGKPSLVRCPDPDKVS